MLNKPAAGVGLVPMLPLDETSSSAAPMMLKTVLGTAVDDTTMVQNETTVFQICDVIVSRQHKTYIIRNGEKFAHFDACRPAIEAVLSEIRACFMSGAFQTFYVTNDTGFHVGNFSLFKAPHPTDKAARRVMCDIMTNCIAIDERNRLPRVQPA